MVSSCVAPGNWNSFSITQGLTMRNRGRAEEEEEEVNWSTKALQLNHNNWESLKELIYYTGISISLLLRCCWELDSIEFLARSSSSSTLQGISGYLEFFQLINLNCLSYCGGGREEEPRHRKQTEGIVWWSIGWSISCVLSKCSSSSSSYYLHRVQWLPLLHK